MTPRAGRAVRLLLAAFVAATTSVLLPAAPATAAGCATADGVTVVVDFHGLGGGAQSVCLPDGGGDKASTLFPAAGFALEYVPRQPGFVCQVAGKPAAKAGDDPCASTPPANAYWGLWWSDGKSGRWSYATTSASGLSVPDGGYVAFSWNGSSRSTPPGTAPTAHSTPTPTPPPTSRPSQHATNQSPNQSPNQSTSPPSSAAASASDGPSASATGSAGKATKPDGKKARKPRGTPTPTATEPGSSPSETTDDVRTSSAEPPDAGDDGLPTWVAPVVVVLLFGAAGGVAFVRRRRTGAV